MNINSVSPSLHLLHKYYMYLICNSYLCVWVWENVSCLINDWYSEILYWRAKSPHEGKITGFQDNFKGFICNMWLISHVDKYIYNNKAVWLSVLLKLFHVLHQEDLQTETSDIEYHYTNSSICWSPADTFLLLFLCYSYFIGYVWLWFC